MGKGGRKDFLSLGKISDILIRCAGNNDLMDPFASREVLIPEFLRKLIATFDFSGGSGPHVPL